MTDQIFTAPGSLEHAHAGGLLSIRAVGGKGGIIPMITPTGSTRQSIIQTEQGRRAVNAGAIQVEAGAVEVFVNATSGVSADYPIEISINSIA
jgi:hypothetical protein